MTWITARKKTSLSLLMAFSSRPVLPCSRNCSANSRNVLQARATKPCRSVNRPSNAGIAVAIGRDDYRFDPEQYYVAVDIEMIGGWASSDRITKIDAVKTAIMG